MKTILAAFALSLAIGQAAPLKVASLHPIVADLARQVGGANVEVIEILKPGGDIHHFEPAPKDIAAMRGAKLLLASGKELETYLDKLRDSLGASIKLVEVGEKIPSIPYVCNHDHGDGDHDHHHGQFDPHWWHSVKNAKIATKVIRDAFIAADPANTDTYKTNATAYQAKLDDLAKWVRTQVALLPADKRKLVTSHDAFQYFARENGFTIFAVEGLSTSDQPTSYEVAALIQTIKAQSVKAVFAESAVNPKVIQEITQETHATLGGELLADGLGGSSASSYDAMVRSNVTTIVNALK